MRNNSPAIMLFAAGFGTRMGALTKKQPKPLIKVAGRPLIDHALKLFDDIHASNIVVNLHYKAAMLEEYLQDKAVQTIHEYPEILDTGGGLKNALPLLGYEPVITSNSDAVWVGPNPIKLLMKAWNPIRMDALLMCIPTKQAHGHKGSGDFKIEPDGQLSRSGDNIYGGLQILKTDLLQTIMKPNFSLNMIWDQMAANRSLFGVKYSGKWCDVGHPGGITAAELMLASFDV